MSIYDTLAVHYDEIFPFSSQRVDFITGWSVPEEGPVLDIGCATGTYAISLAKKKYQVTGIDLNDMMISYAREKANNEQVDVHFLSMNMLLIDTLTSGPFSLITCFGNTLPHLSSYIEIQTFFLKAYTSLTSHGTFIFQIINFDTIKQEKQVHFPVIETDNFIFKRFYTFQDTGRIKFHILLQDKTTGMMERDSTILLPLMYNKLIDTLKAAGFKKIDLFGDYKLAPVTKDSFSVIYVAKKS